MPLVVEYAKRLGVYDDMLPLLPMALGAGETTVMRQTAAYAMFVNGGKRIKPTLIDRIQDRCGRTIYQHDERECDDCDADKWAEQQEPKLVDKREQVLDPFTAYQITSILEGVVQRGTATVRQGGRQAARRQDRHDQRGQGRLVRRLLARPRGRRLPRLRQAAIARQDGHGRRARGADLPRLHDDGAEGQAGDAVPRPRRASSSSRSTALRACARGGAGVDPRGLQARHRAARELPFVGGRLRGRPPHGGEFTPGRDAARSAAAPGSGERRASGRLDMSPDATVSRRSRPCNTFPE